jgi:uncharacterized protein (UPF0305 family)
MIRNVTRRYFEIWGNEEAQNAILKLILSVLGVLFVIQSLVLTVVVLRKPVLIAVGERASQILTLTPPSDVLLEAELKRLVRQYVEAHYNWDYTTIAKAHENAARYVSDKFVKAFTAANADQIRTVREKKVNERVYLSGDIQVDREHLIARVPMDRVFSVDGIRATSPLTLDVQFEYGPRTSLNPEGVYITGEKVITQSN